MFAEGVEISSIKPSVLEKIYKVYKDKDDDLIMAEGIGQFCEDLGVDPSDPITLVISRFVKVMTEKLRRIPTGGNGGLTNIVLCFFAHCFVGTWGQM